MVDLVIPCPHDSGAVADFKQFVPDFHPLNRDEIAELLTLDDGTALLNSRIQIRLTQAIRGMTCPRPVRGPVSSKAEELEALLAVFFRNTDRTIDDLVEMLDQLINQ